MVGVSIFIIIFVGVGFDTFFYQIETHKFADLNPEGAFLGFKCHVVLPNMVRYVCKVAIVQYFFVIFYDNIIHVYF